MSLQDQVTQLTQQLNALQTKFNNLGTLPGITQDQQGAFSNRLFQRSTASPSTYTIIVDSTPTMAVCDGFYELENGIYVPFYRRKT